MNYEKTNRHFHLSVYMYACLCNSNAIMSNITVLHASIDYNYDIHTVNNVPFILHLYQYANIVVICTKLLTTFM